MKRRGFLSACLALGVAPAIVRAESLMKIVKPSLAEITAYSLRPGQCFTFTPVAENTGQVSVVFNGRLWIAENHTITYGERNFAEVWL